MVRRPRRRAATQQGPVDYDGDGDEDVWIGYHDQGAKSFRNDGSGTYTRVAASARPRVNAAALIPERHQCAWADVDRNGLVDAYCGTGRGAQAHVKTGKDNEFWVQTAVGQFIEAGTAWGAGDVCGRSHYVACLNASGDGFPDLFVGNAPPRPVTGDPCDKPAKGLPNEKSKPFLDQAGSSFTSGYRSNRGTGFADLTAANGLAATHLDASFGDLDRDGDLDSYALVSNMPAGINPNDFVLRNNGLSFTAVTVPPASGIGDAVAALDGNGDRRHEFLVLNGVEVAGPTRRIELRFQ